MPHPDAVVVGSGPNGLAAAVILARAGLAVRVLERESAIGGGTRTAALTVPGFRHDVCSAVHPLALASPFFRAFDLESRVAFTVPDVSFAQPLERGRSALAFRDLARTADELGRDGRAYRRLLDPLVNRAEEVTAFTGAPALPLPRHLRTATRFGRSMVEQGTGLWNARFREDAAPALLTGAMAHAIHPLPSLGSTATGLLLTALAHRRGWPIPVGGSQAIAEAMADDIRAHGGEIVTEVDVASLDQVADAQIVMLDVTPRALLGLAGDRLPQGYRRALASFRYGNGVAKLDLALNAPVPWADARLHAAGTVHVGGSRAELAHAEREVAHGRHPARPYVLISQPSLFDPTRAPEGMHTLWAYTHVPSGSRADVTQAVFAQIERFAPGFRDTIVAVSTRDAAAVAAHNPNTPGGDIAAGAVSLPQLVRRPVLSSHPWRTPLPGVYLCSASVAPGPGVHGMVGWHAARDALAHELGLPAPAGFGTPDERTP